MKLSLSVSEALSFVDAVREVWLKMKPSDYPKVAVRRKIVV
jgi:hypothetical protein